MKTAIVTDSNSGIFSSEAKELGVYVVPMPILIDDRENFEGVNIQFNEFVHAQTSGKSITTSQPTPSSVMSLWDEVLEEFDELVYIPMSSALSGSCNTAKLLSADYNGKVQVVDNHRISVTQKISVIQAKKLAEQEKTAVEIKNILEADSYNASIYIAVDNLEYLKKGGRITPAVATFASILSIKPVLSIFGGKLDVFAKARGINKAKRLMISSLKNEIETRYANYNSQQLYVATATSCQNPSDAMEWTNMVHEAFPEYDIMSDYLPLSIITHTGPDALGIGVYPKNV